MTKHRRRTYLIKTGLQLRYMGIIISTMLMVAFGVGWITYDTSWSQIANTPDLTLDKLSVIFDSVNNLLLRWIGIFVLVIAALSILVSHKIAGPVYRLEETTKLIASGDLTHRIHLRQGDELRDLQDAFNKMSESSPENEDIRQHPDFELFGVSVAVNYCKVVVGLTGPNEDLTAFSSGVNNTARLQGIADANTVLVTSSVRDIAVTSCSENWSFEGPDKIAVKNVKDPITYYKLKLT
jgi:methyl-accepting chemotaxis protein